MNKANILKIQELKAEIERLEVEEYSVAGLDGLSNESISNLFREVQNYRKALKNPEEFITNHFSAPISVQETSQDPWSKYDDYGDITIRWTPYSNSPDETYIDIFKEKE